MRREWLTAEQKDRIRKLKADGLTARQIATRMGCSYFTVWRQFKMLEAEQETTRS